MSNRSGLVIAFAVLLVLGVTGSSVQSAYAHTFSGDESASFLATVEVIKVQLELAKNDFATDVAMAAEHAEHAREHLTNDTIEEIFERNERLGTELPAALDEFHEALEDGMATAADVNDQVANINDLLGETVTVRIENTQLSNSTVQGIMFADFVDEILESYSGAYGVEEEEHEEGEEGEHDDGSMVNEGEGDETATTGGNGNHNTIVNMMEYESAQALAARAQELFDTKLKAMAEANATEAVGALDAGLDELKAAIDDKAPLEDVDLIIHADIHPNIQTAYSLQVIPEFPLPVLAAVLGIASVAVYSRMKGKSSLQ